MLDMIREDNSITTDFYRKATDTYQYLQWTSSHPDHLKSSIVRTLMRHAEALIKDRGIRTEKEKVRVALRNCVFPEWALNEGEQLDNRQKRREEEEEGQDEKCRHEKHKKAFVVLPYMKKVMERLQRAYQEHNIQLLLGRYTIRNAVVHLKDPVD